MAVNSRNKHFRAHEDFAKCCRSHGFPAVHCTNGRIAHGSLPGISLTIVRTERLRLDQAMEKAVSAARDGLPVLAHRTNRRCWKITMELPDFFTLYRAYLQTSQPGQE